MQNDHEMLNSIRQTTQMGCYGIQTVLPECEDPELADALRQQLSEYARLFDEADRLLDAHGGRKKDINPMAKYGSAMTSMVKVRASRDPGSKIAELMLQGNTRGMIKSIHNSRTMEALDPKVSALSNRLLQTEQANIDQMKRFL